MSLGAFSSAWSSSSRVKRMTRLVSTHSMPISSHSSSAASKRLLAIWSSETMTFSLSNLRPYFFTSFLFVL